MLAELYVRQSSSKGRASRAEAAGDDKIARLEASLYDACLPQGGWPAEPGGGVDLSTSVLVYLAMKLLRGADGIDELRTTRRHILRLGGPTAVDAEAREWLALFCQWPQTRSEACTGGRRRPLTPLRVSPLNGVGELLSGGDAGLADSERADADGMGVRADAVSAVQRYVCLAVGGGSSDRRIRHARPSLVATSRAVVSLLQSGMRRSDRPVVAAMHWLLDATRGAASGGGRQPSGADLADALHAFGAWMGAGQGRDAALPPGLALHGTDGLALSHDAQGPGADLVAGRGRELALLLIREQREDGAWHAYCEDERALRLTARATAALAVWRSAARPADELAAKIQRAIERSIEYLAGEQSPSGGWEEAGRGKHAGAAPTATTATLLATLMVAGSDAGDHSVLAAVNWLIATHGVGESRSAATNAAVVSALTLAGFGGRSIVAEAADALALSEPSPEVLLALSRYAVGAPPNGATKAAPRLRLVAEDAPGTARRLSLA
ncbi:MAG: prenyltransferase/squalene oxidase repeat-containing protein [Planctomycetota bacterium]